MASKTRQDGEYPAHTALYFEADSDRVRMHDDPMMDNVITALLALGMETWSIRRRSLVLERLLEEKGVTRDMIEGFMPTEEDVSEWENERDRFVNQVMGPLMREGDLPLSHKREDNQS
jgi:hypothetical protein